MGLNWYVIANKKVLRPKDLFAFYAFMSSPDSFSDREVLINMAEKMNQMRSLYIDTLLNEIADELGHTRDGLDVNYLLTQEGKKIAKPWPSYDEWIEHIYRGNIQEDKDFLNRRYIKYVMDNVDLNDDIQRDIAELINKFREGDVSETDLNKAIYYFNNLPWIHSYGGKLWAEIVKWTRTLMNTPPVDVNLLYGNTNTFDVKRVIEQMRRLGYVLDVINSMEHNTGMALTAIERDSGERDWLAWVLDFAKYASNPLMLAYFSGDPNIIHEVRTNVMSSPAYRPDSYDIVKSMVNTIARMPVYVACEFIEHLSNVKLLMAIAEHIYNDKVRLRCLLANPNLFMNLSDKELIDFIKRLISLMGLNQFDLTFEAVVYAWNLYNRISPDIYNFLRGLNGSHINQALDTLEDRIKMRWK